ncbi:MAG: glucose-6-phosphate dehydrogenase, partial [Pseudomonadota bacterium]
MVSRVIPVEDFDLTIFGGTGDLARRKILPGLLRRFCAGQMPPNARIIGVARGDMTDQAYRDLVAEGIAEFGEPALARRPELDAFLDQLTYLSVDAMGQRGWPELKTHLRQDVVQAFYFSVAPALFGDIAQRLKSHGIADDNARVVVEKPFGKDLPSAQALNAALAASFA